MADVKWIKLMVGMFDGMSFKKIKRAKIGGESFRDKLTAIWFELMDFAGKCNHDGAFISPREIPFKDLGDIAMMIDRDEKELELCMAFYIREGMVTVIDDVYMLSNWAEYQNVEGMEKIREQNRKRVANYREKQKLLTGNVTSNVTVTLGNAIDIDIEEEKEIEKDIDKKEKVDCQQIVDLYHSICKSYPSIRSMSDARRKAIKARLNTYSVEDFKAVFENAENSSFLKGSNNRNWTATFDWLIKDSNFAKVLEGNYADKGKKEIEPDWMKKFSGNTSSDIENMRKLYAKLEGRTAGNSPEIAARAEALKKELNG